MRLMAACFRIGQVLFRYNDVLAAARNAQTPAGSNRGEISTAANCRLRHYLAIVDGARNRAVGQMSVAVPHEPFGAIVSTVQKSSQSLTDTICGGLDCARSALEPLRLTAKAHAAPRTVHLVIVQAPFGPSHGACQRVLS